MYEIYMRKIQLAINTTKESLGNLVSSEKFLKEYLNHWQSNTFTFYHLRRIFMFLDRFYLPK